MQIRHPLRSKQFEKIHGTGGEREGYIDGRTPLTSGFLLHCNRVYGRGSSPRDRAVNI